MIDLVLSINEDDQSKVKEGLLSSSLKTERDYYWRIFEACKYRLKLSHEDLALNSKSISYASGCVRES